MSRRPVVLGAVLAVLAVLVSLHLVGTNRHPAGTSTAVRIAVATPAVPGLRSAFLQVGQTRRHYLLYVPPSASGVRRPAPLVVAFHGLHLSAAWMAHNTGLLSAAKRAAVVVALPDALDGAWNDGRLGTSGPDDVRFATTLVDTLVHTGVADPRRVTLSGYSNGAELALVLASLHPSTFSAVVSISGELPALPGAPRPSTPIPAWFTHGTADPVQPWNGRPTRNRLHPALLSEDATVHAFVAADRGGTPSSVPIGGNAVEQIVWPRRPDGARVVLYRLLGAAHGWPTAPACGTPLCEGRLDAAALIVSVASH